MAKVFIFQPSSLEQREVSEAEADRAERELGWVRIDGANRLVAIHHPGANDHKMVLQRDVANWENKGYFAEPTVVYHPEEGEKMVSAEQAGKMLGQGWYDSPAKFPGNEDGIMAVKKTKTKE